MTSLALRSRSRVLPFVVAVAGVVLVSIAAYSGRTPSALSSHGVDKVIHAAMSATLTFLLARALRGRAWLAAMMVFVPVAIDEYFQRYSPARSSDWGDLAADAFGVLVAVAIVRATSRMATPAQAA